MRTFTAAASFATAAEQAIAQVTRRLPAGCTCTGVTQVRSRRHLIMDVQVAVDDDVTQAQLDDCWVVLTSYGISPSADLGSAWQKVAGVGC